MDSGSSGEDRPSPLDWCSPLHPEFGARRRHRCPGVARRASRRITQGSLLRPSLLLTRLSQKTPLALLASVLRPLTP
jgi:hypothetical protein